MRINKGTVRPTCLYLNIGLSPLLSMLPGTRRCYWAIFVVNTTPEGFPNKNTNNCIRITRIHIVRFSWMAVKEPQMFPPMSGNVGHPGKGFTLPLRSTLTGYFMRWPLISVTSLEMNWSQLCSPRRRTRLMHSRLSGWLKSSSITPICSAQRDIL